MIDQRQSHLELLYFSFFPATHALGPAITIKRLASHLARHAPLEILTLNYDERTRLPLFKGSYQTVEHESGYVVTYIPYDIRRYFSIFKRFISVHSVICIHCMFDYRVSIPALIIGKLLFRSKRLFHIPHGIFLSIVFSKKSLRKKIFCRVVDIFGLSSNLVHIASSDQEALDIKRSFKTAQEIVVLPHFGQMPRVDALKTEPKRSGELRLCFVGRVAAQKNIIGAVEILSRMRVPCELDIIGEIADETYYQSCLRKIELLPPNVSVRFVGLIAHDELLERLVSYHLFFFPTLGENFGHAILEALGCGLPALISNRTPWNDLEKHGAGWVFDLASPDRFVEVLERVYSAGSEFSRAGAIAYAAAVASPPGLEEALLETFGLNR